MKGDVKHLMELGLRGVKLHPDIQAFKIDDYRCLKIYELCEENGLPILMHTGDNRYDYSNPNRLLPILEIYTNLKVIGAHLGGWSIWEEAAKAYCKMPNFYVDCSSSFPYLKPETALSVIRKYGADKVLFGTDYPMWDAESELKYFLNLPLEKNEINDILNMNAKRLFGLE
jgi:predicted TIM-barrel fold metal-dependent hydrolase